MAPSDFSLERNPIQAFPGAGLIRATFLSGVRVIYATTLAPYRKLSKMTYMYKVSPLGGRYIIFSQKCFLSNVVKINPKILGRSPFLFAIKFPFIF